MRGQKEGQQEEGGQGALKGLCLWWGGGYWVARRNRREGRQEEEYESERRRGRDEILSPTHAHNTLPIPWQVRWDGRHSRLPIPYLAGPEARQNTVTSKLFALAGVPHLTRLQGHRHAAPRLQGGSNVMDGWGSAMLPPPKSSQIQSYRSTRHVAGQRLHASPRPTTSRIYYRYISASA